MCSSAEDVRKKAEWAGAEGGSRAALVRELQSTAPGAGHPSATRRAYSRLASCAAPPSALSL